MSQNRSNNMDNALGVSVICGLAVSVAGLLCGWAINKTKKDKAKKKQHMVASDITYHSGALRTTDHDGRYVESQLESYHGKTALQVLEEVCAKIKLSEDKIKNENKYLKQFLDIFLIQKLKESDPLFAKIFQNILWAGSFYDGLKIDAPNEFDLNVVLRFPFRQSLLEVTTHEVPPAYAQINNFASALNEYINDTHFVVLRKMESWCDLRGTLLQTRVREWFEGLMTRVLLENEHILEQNFGTVRLIKSGPAMTLQFLDRDVSVDLVPVFEFQTVGRYKMDPPYPFKSVEHKWPWYAVPKPCEGRPDVWRLSFCSQEKDMIHDKGRLKPAIKLMKKLRDTENWKNLASYYIKTIFLWETYELDGWDENFDWNSDLAQTFMLMVKRLIKCLEHGEIRSYWDPRYNLLSGLSHMEIENIKFRLIRLNRKFLDNYRTNPEVIGQIICPSP